MTPLGTEKKEEPKIYEIPSDENKKKNKATTAVKRTKAKPTVAADDLD